MNKTFKEIANGIAELVEKKNVAYGNSFEQSCKVLEVLYPNGVQVKDYKNLLTITRILDKLFRIATSQNAFNEDPWADINGYSLLMLQSTSKVDENA